MKLFLLALFLGVFALGVRAAEDEQQQQQPPEEIPDFSSLDEYVYQPKNVVYFGYRYSSGIKVGFSGKGTIGSPESLGDTTTSNVLRVYNDGTVSPDARTQAGSDGKTNTWSYDSSTQLAPDGKSIQFHLYSAEILDSAAIHETAKGNTGMELIMAHDMGRLSKRLSWKIFGGFSLNDIQAATMSNMRATVTTVTDTFGVDQPAPQAPYTAPSFASVTDPTTGLSTAVDNTTLLGNTPLAGRSHSSATDTTSVVSHWKLHGAYATLRAGPTFVYDISDRIHFNVSVGPALIYAGSTYEVDEVILPPTGGDVIDTLVSTKSKLLFAYYGDATLQYDVTERTGLYFGAFYQHAGGYTQTDQGTTGMIYTNGNNAPAVSDYTTNVDFGSQQGFRTGISFRF